MENWPELIDSMERGRWIGKIGFCIHRYSDCVGGKGGFCVPGEQGWGMENQRREEVWSFHRVRSLQFRVRGRPATKWISLSFRYVATTPRPFPVTSKGCSGLRFSNFGGMEQGGDPECISLLPEGISGG